MWTQQAQQVLFYTLNTCNTCAFTHSSSHNTWEAPAPGVLGEKGSLSLVTILRSWVPGSSDLPSVLAGVKSYLLQVDSRRWPAPLAPTHPVPCHMLQGTALVHLYLGRRSNQVSPHQALGGRRNAQTLAQSRGLHSHAHFTGSSTLPPPLSLKHFPMSRPVILLTSTLPLSSACSQRLCLSLQLPSLSQSSLLNIGYQLLSLL